MSMFLRRFLFFIVALPIMPGCDCPVRATIPFDSARWKGDIVDAQPGKDRRRAIGDTRHGMLKSLDKSGILNTAMTKDDVAKILGSPSRVYSKDEMHRPSPGADEFWYYDIGCQCTYCSQFLVVFDDRGFYLRHQINGQ